MDTLNVLPVRMDIRHNGRSANQGGRRERSANQNERSERSTTRDRAEILTRRHQTDKAGDGNHRVSHGQMKGARETTLSTAERESGEVSRAHCRIATISRRNNSTYLGSIVQQTTTTPPNSTIRSPPNRTAR
ncbi:hypothetical protein BaRGS_00038089 [Batillaria attramentaria]|uniref:Uncharacterized protein n=1 Tax=Batillaria attramentaria TaxID=370345 RepID=A0ABD0J6U3_9CAEN